MKQRLIFIDYLKVMGLMLVILAHVNCPPFIMQIRSFDVPLLVFLSGYLAYISYNINKKGYYAKRIFRLAMPSWIFLVVFFCIQAMVYTVPSLEDILKAVTFQRDSNMVGMLWVIWVYLVCSFVIPIIFRMGYNKYSILMILLLFVIYEIFCSYTNVEENRLIYLTVLTIIPWGTITYIGFYYDEMSKRDKKILFYVSIMMFILLMSYFIFKHGTFIMTNDYKYPARLYYLCFSIPIILCLMEVGRKIKLKENKFILFISSSSLWIYLWHILALYAVKSFIIDDRFWGLQYLLIVIISVFTTFVQNRIARILIEKFDLKFFKVFLG